ncbi:MAG: hypothetical protein MMC33_005002 [Icmadophila ericetorum]|nr:hypothetical protein [Icmadophila ericetorum]
MSMLDLPMSFGFPSELKPQHRRFEQLLSRLPHDKPLLNDPNALEEILGPEFEEIISWTLDEWHEPVQGYPAHTSEEILHLLGSL